MGLGNGAQSRAGQPLPPSCFKAWWLPWRAPEDSQLPCTGCPWPPRNREGECGQLHAARLPVHAQRRLSPLCWENYGQLSSRASRSPESGWAGEVPLLRGSGPCHPASASPGKHRQGDTRCENGHRPSGVPVSLPLSLPSLPMYPARGDRHPHFTEGEPRLLGSGKRASRNHRVADGFRSLPALLCGVCRDSYHL